MDQDVSCKFNPHDNRQWAGGASRHKTPDREFIRDFIKTWLLLQDFDDKVRLLDIDNDWGLMQLYISWLITGWPGSNQKSSESKNSNTDWVCCARAAE